MTIEQHSGFNPDAHINEVDGDILPYVQPLEPPDYLADLPTPVEHDLYLIESSVNDVSTVETTTLPTEVQQAMDTVDADAKKYQARGYKPDRVKELAGRGRSLALLAARGIDISGALPSESLNSNEQDDFITSEQEKQIDHLMDTTGLSYNDAKNKVVS